MRIPNIAVSSLTLAEHLLTWRRREGYTQPDAAAVLGLHDKTYILIEREQSKETLSEKPLLGDLYSHEICFLLRRRSGWTIPQCAEQAGVSRYWYNLMEQGKVSPDRLVEYWGDDGR